jgi:hypothetical protein
MATVHPEKWLPISSAPADSDLEVCVIDKQEVHALAFPCRRNGTEWIDASTRKRIDIAPTHWRFGGVPRLSGPGLIDMLHMGYVDEVLFRRRRGR